MSLSQNTNVLAYTNTSESGLLFINKDFSLSEKEIVFDKDNALSIDISGDK